MKYVSTRHHAPPVDFEGALLGGLAPDGGLYVPEAMPLLPEGWQGWGYRDAVTDVVQLFGAAPSAEIVDEAASLFRDPEVAPIKQVGDRHVLELFWGPTLSFKDHALQVLARLLDRAVADNADHRSTILGATSGDTGSAAMEACRGRDHLEVFILFPDGMVSEFQRRQMTTLPDANVHAIAVRGTFDDCQALVKGAFSDESLGPLLAVNSINWARIAAQVGYYVYAAAAMGTTFDVVVPTGNFGNVYSAWVAKQMGASIDRITIANNANRRLARLVQTGEERTEAVVPTVAPAMDIQRPSNLERLQGHPPSAHFRAGWATDEQMLATMARVLEEHGYLLDPHTAAAWHVGTEKLRPGIPQLVVATADPAKFPEAARRAVEVELPPPPGFEHIYEAAERVVTIDPDPSALADLIR